MRYPQGEPCDHPGCLQRVSHPCEECGRVMGCYPWELAMRRVSLSVPWVHHGRDPRHGMDCVGLLICVYSLRGIDVSDLDVPYSIRDWRQERRAGLLVERLSVRFREVPLHGLEDGDVLVTKVEGAPSHPAIVVGDHAHQMTATGIRRDRLRAVLRFTERAFRYGKEA